MDIATGKPAVAKDSIGPYNSYAALKYPALVSPMRFIIGILKSIPIIFTIITLDANIAAPATSDWLLDPVLILFFTLINTP